jgi:hypothetical protein
MVMVLNLKQGVVGPERVRDASGCVRVVLPFTIDDEAILVATGREPEFDFPYAGTIPTQGKFPGSPMVKIAGGENLFGLRGVAGQFDGNRSGRSGVAGDFLTPGGSTRRGGVLHGFSFHNQNDWN